MTKYHKERSLLEMIVISAALIAITLLVYSVAASGHVEPTEDEGQFYTRAMNTRIEAREKAMILCGGCHG